MQPASVPLTAQTAQRMEPVRLREFGSRQLGIVRAEGFHPDDRLYGSTYWGSHEIDRAPSAAAVAAREQFLIIRAELQRRNEQLPGDWAQRR